MRNKRLIQRISIDPKIMVGKPVIKGTRIPVELVVALLSEGMKVDEIIEEYPTLSKEDIQACIKFSKSI